MKENGYGLFGNNGLKEYFLVVVEMYEIKWVKKYERMNNSAFITFSYQA